MTINDFLLMRHEIMLVLIALILLIVDLNLKPTQKPWIIPVAMVLFIIHIIVGFLPAPEGTLFGGMFRSTPLINMMKNVLNIGVFIIMLQSYTWIMKPENREKMSEYFVLMFSTLAGMYFMISSGDFLMFYLGLETATIPMAALAAYTHHQTKSAEAGVKLILSSALSSGILLFGLSLIYGSTGSIYFTDVAASFGDAPMQVLAFLFFFSGMAFKISLVPFHLWTADVYEGSPVNVTSYFSVISKGAASFILILILYKVFFQLIEVWQNVLYIISVLTMVVGNLFALRQKNMKRFLAFSSIAQAGFILLGMMAGSQMGMTSVIYFVLVYIFSNLGAFGVVSAIEAVTGKVEMSDYNGLYRTNPRLSLLMMLAMFSLAGIPPVAGFFGKFFLFTSAASAGYYWLVFIAVLNATVSLYYYLMVVKAMFINKSDEPIAFFRSDNMTRAGLLLSAVGIVVIGFWSQVYEMINNLSVGLF
ncbi:MAG: NADH-quinone oxidoreductase subunit N [Bacteroidetes bacterium HGW-Bacteroidetes-9]|jgi:NADH-quinone oxidoreductase subunit N|nr:MAG: NADH-quinone oxidoreductase subunit N [Bacteroidetes bacterium HGW-Bacteroidetes-9]